jgi:hypothetical protein
VCFSVLGHSIGLQTAKHQMMRISVCCVSWHTSQVPRWGAAGGCHTSPTQSWSPHRPAHSTALKILVSVLQCAASWHTSQDPRLGAAGGCRTSPTQSWSPHQPASSKATRYLSVCLVTASACCAETQRMRWCQQTPSWSPHQPADSRAPDDAHQCVLYWLAHVSGSSLGGIRWMSYISDSVLVTASACKQHSTK